MTMLRIANHPYVLSLGSAALIGAGYCFPQHGWPLMLIGLVPILAALRAPDMGGRRAFLAGALFGAAFSGINTAWLFQALPLDWAGIGSPALSVSLIAMTWSAIALLAGCAAGLWAVLIAAAAKTWPAGKASLIAAAAWTALEYARVYAFSILFLGPHSDISGHWAFGVLGNALAWSPLLPLATLGGTYLLSFSAVVANAIALIALRRARSLSKRSSWTTLSSKDRLILGSITLLVSASCIHTIALHIRTIQHSPAAPEGPLAAIAHTDFSERALDDPYADQRKGIALRSLLLRIKADSRSPEILILPEDSQLITSIDREYRQRYFSDMLGPGEHLIIDSGHIFDGTGPDSRAFFYNTLSDLTASAAKRAPIPNGEYIPWVTLLPLTLAGRDDIIRNFLETRSLERIETARYGTYGTLRIGTLLCSEIFSPILPRGERGIPPDIIANLSSHSVFHGSRMLGRQTLALAKVRAAENGRPVIIAGNMTPSAAIDPDGHIIASDDGSGMSVSYVRIPLSDRITPYRTYGDWIAIFSLLVSAAATAAILDKSRRKL